MSNRNIMNLVNTTIPYTWDDSVSVYEMLGKLISKINEVVEEVNLKLPDDFENKFYEKFNEYTREEMQRILDSGEFAAILDSMTLQFGKEIKRVDGQLDQKANRSDINNPSRTEVKYFAHRGLSSIAPENTIPAIELAGQLGYYGVEIDLRPTKDNKFVLIHDPNINSMTNGTGLIENLTLSEIHSFYVNKGTNISKYPDLKMATLEECLSVCKKYGMRCLIEIKDYSSDLQIQYIVDIIKQFGMEEQVNIMFYFGTGVAKEVRRLNDKITIEVIASAFYQDNLDLAISLGNCIMNIQSINLNKTIVDLCHSNGFLVNTHTVNTLKEAQNLMRYGVDFITTDTLL